MVSLGSRRIPWILVDGLVAAVLLLLMAQGVRAWPALLAATGMCGAVAVRRLVPLTAFAVAAGAVLAMFGSQYEKDPMVAVGLTLYAVAAARSYRVSTGALLAGWAVAVLAATGLTPYRMPHDAVVASGAVLLAGACAGWGMRAHRIATAAVRKEEEQRARADVERALAEERLRIARDLHDVVAHTMSVIAVQSTVGAHLNERRPGAGGDALRIIEEATRSGLDELRTMLRVLREPSTSPASPAPPAPDLSTVAELIERIRATGVDVHLAVAGRRRPLPAGVELCAYRIVQEALTNVVRHSRATRAVVRLCYRTGELGVDVHDDGIGVNGAAEGHGLPGMRERATALGGTLHAGPDPAGGFRVAARLPVVREPVTVV